jgi:hypothetical protein
MLTDLFMTLGKGVAEQLTYWCHTYLPFPPFSRWRAATDEVIAAARENAARYGIEVDRIDRRNAYQVARMSVPNRHGEHLADLVPDAYNRYSPTCCAKTHSGKKKIAAPLERRREFLEHPQTLAYLLVPSSLARLGLGGSAPGTIMGVPIGQPTPPAGVIAGNLREALGGKGGRDVDVLAGAIAKLHAGLPRQEGQAA